MKLLICGDRNWTDEKLIIAELERLKPELVIHRECKGPSTIGGQAAEYLGIAHLECGANWHDHGRQAGEIANEALVQMAPDLVLAFHDNMDASKITKDVIARATAAGIPVDLVCHEVK